MSSNLTSKKLSDDARKIALELAKRSTGKARSAAPKAKKNFKPAIQFSELKDYQEIQSMKMAAQALGASNPFFRSHDARAGATTLIDGKTYVNFASYDYLGLNGHPEVSKAAQDAIDHYGTSASASRLVAGERPIHRELERSFAKHYGVEDAIVFVSGHATNVATIGYLMDEKDLIIHDSYIHNSAMMGAKLSGASRRSFEHNNFNALISLLEEHRNKYRNALIIVEGLYSMDGDTSDLNKLIEIKEKYGAWLMVDEAHALGITGANGYGSREKYNIDPAKVDIWMGTLSKTLGAAGGYIAGCAALIELLKSRAPGFVYSVGLSPALAAAANKSLELIHEEPDRIKRLQSNGKYFVKIAQEAGLDTGFSEGYAVTPILLGDSLIAAKLTEGLLEKGYNVMPILYPAVPMKSARLRFFITSEHTKEQLDSAVGATSEVLRDLNYQA